MRVHIEPTNDWLGDNPTDLILQHRKYPGPESDLLHGDMGTDFDSEHVQAFELAGQLQREIIAEGLAIINR